MPFGDMPLGTDCGAITDAPARATAPEETMLKDIGVAMANTGLGDQIF